MAHEARGTDEIAKLLRRSYPAALHGIVAVDGTDGVGKTTLAVALRAAVGGTVVSLDDFVAENCGGYVPHLRTAEFKTALETASRPCIVDGVCVLAALERVSYKPDVLIYVKRLASYGFWHDADTCDPSEPVEELIDRLANEVAAVARFDAELDGQTISDDEKPALTPLREEIIRYHALYRPSRCAEMLFMRTEEA